MHFLEIFLLGFFFLTIFGDFRAPWATPKTVMSWSGKMLSKYVQVLSLFFFFWWMCCLFFSFTYTISIFTCLYTHIFCMLVMGLILWWKWLWNLMSQVVCLICNTEQQVWLCGLDGISSIVCNLIIFLEWVNGIFCFSHYVAGCSGLF